MKFCTQCGAQLPEDAVFCVQCGQPCAASATPPVQSAPQPQYTYQQPQPSPSYQQAQTQHTYQQAQTQYTYQQPQYAQQPPQQAQSGNLFDSVTKTINQFAGGSGAVRPPIKTLFSKIFIKHSRQEAEEIFACSKATPGLTNSETAWPQPWLYTRVLLAFAAAFVMLYLCASNLNNLNVYPGLMVIGAFTVPIAAFIFFFEMNTPRNISTFTAIKIFLVGGCASFLMTLVLFEIVPVSELDFGGAILVGIVEELGKLAIVAFFIWQEKTYKHTINGLLIGAAVGAGFAAVESAGYAFRSLLANGLDGMIDSILLRAVFAPGGHVVWAAMSGYAIILAKRNALPGQNFLQRPEFWKVFWIPVAMHAVWDMPITFGAEIYLVQVLLLVASWVVIFVIISNCLNHIAEALQEQQTQPVPATAAAPSSAPASASNDFDITIE